MKEEKSPNSGPDLGFGPSPGLKGSHFPAVTCSFALGSVFGGADLGTAGFGAGFRLGAGGGAALGAGAAADLNPPSDEPAHDDPPEYPLRPPPLLLLDPPPPLRFFNARGTRQAASPPSGTDIKHSDFRGTISWASLRGVMLADCEGCFIILLRKPFALVYDAGASILCCSLLLYEL